MISRDNKQNRRRSRRREWGSRWRDRSGVVFVPEVSYTARVQSGVGRNDALLEDHGALGAASIILSLSRSCSTSAACAEIVASFSRSLLRAPADFVTKCLKFVTPFSVTSASRRLSAFASTAAIWDVRVLLRPSDGFVRADFSLLCQRDRLMAMAFFCKRLPVLLSCHPPVGRSADAYRQNRSCPGNASSRSDEPSFGLAWRRRAGLRPFPHGGPDECWSRDAAV